MTDPVVLEFVAIAERYCSLIESRANHERTQFLQQIRKLLLELYRCALELPNIGRCSKTKIRRGTYEEWRAVFHDLRALLGESDYYGFGYYPYPRSDEQPGGSLADDLADIYRDLIKGLDLFNRGKKVAMLYAIYLWRLHFFGHWGVHLTDALRPLHAILENEFMNEE